MTEFTLPWPPAGLSPNARVHYHKLAALKKKYRRDCAVLVMEQGAKWMAPGAKDVSLTFYPPTKRWPDWDNCIAAFKAGMDGISDAIGVDDSLFRIRFEVKREKGGCVVVRISDALEGASCG
ncbi:MAG: endodeoxyribonuclease RusA [Patescibacteria group bacterium]|nr:endodeoxyribonuclease RusA [Patescibacteria group bacterium]